MFAPFLQKHAVKSPTLLRAVSWALNGKAKMNIEEIKQILASWINEGFIEGELSVEPEWYVLWQPEEIEEINKDYELSKYAPGFISFGGNGGGELLVVNQKGEVFYMPSIGMSSDEAIKIAGGFKEFKGYMQQ